LQQQQFTVARGTKKWRAHHFCNRKLRNSSDRNSRFKSRKSKSRFILVQNT